MGLEVRRCCLLFVLLGLMSQGVDITTDSFDYSNASYWEHRYHTQPRTHEWYSCDWRSLSSSLEDLISKEHRILHLGSGNSKLPEQMWHAGFRNQVATDISRVVVEQMRKHLSQEAPNLEFRVENALQ